MKTVQNDLDSHGLSWTDAADLAQNRPLWRLLATSGAMHSCKPEKKKKITPYILNLLEQF